MKTLLVAPTLPRSPNSVFFPATALLGRLSLVLSVRSKGGWFEVMTLLLTVRACFIMPSIHSSFSPLRSNFFAFGPASPTSLPCQELRDEVEEGIVGSSVAPGVPVMKLGIGGGASSLVK